MLFYIFSMSVLLFPVLRMPTGTALDCGLQGPAAADPASLAETTSYKSEKLTTNL